MASADKIDQQKGWRTTGCTKCLAAAGTECAKDCENFEPSKTKAQVLSAVLRWVLKQEAGRQRYDWSLLKQVADEVDLDHDEVLEAVIEAEAAELMWAEPGSSAQQRLAWAILELREGRDEEGRLNAGILIKCTKCKKPLREYDPCPRCRPDLCTNQLKEYYRDIDKELSALSNNAAFANGAIRP